MTTYSVYSVTRNNLQECHVYYGTKKEFESLSIAFSFKHTGAMTKFCAGRMSYKGAKSYAQSLSAVVPEGFKGKAYSIKDTLEML